MTRHSWLRRGAALAWALCLPLAGCGGGDYTTVRPEMGPIQDLVEDTGTVAYRDPYAVIPLASGLILSCSFEEGDRVRAGQELYVIDSGDLEDQIDQASLSLDTAQENYRQALEAQGDLTVRTSAAGTVTAVHVHEGDYISAGTPVADVVDSGTLTLTVPFSPADAAAIAPGAAATVTFAAYSGQVAATVARVYDAPTPLSGGREGVYVEFRLTNPGALTAGTVAMAAVGAMACTEAGALSYATEQSVYAGQSGQVLDLIAREGDVLAPGQAVLTLDNASVSNAAASAALSLESARLNLSQLEAKREDYRILAPADGVITQRLFKTGDYAAAATSMATLVDPEDMCVNAAIDELYIDRVWAGQEASVTFTTDTGERRTYAAEVYRVDDTGTASGGVTDYTVELRLEDTEGLKAGMNVDVSITAASREDCLRIPASAVSGGAVQVLRGGRAVEVPVETGVSGGGYVEILSGLTPEDEVIIP